MVTVGLEPNFRGLFLVGSTSRTSQNLAEEAFFPMVSTVAHHPNSRQAQTLVNSHIELNLGSRSRMLRNAHTVLVERVAQPEFAMRE